jgi:hypothetical protein
MSSDIPQTVGGRGGTLQYGIKVLVFDIEPE